LKTPIREDWRKLADKNPNAIALAPHRPGLHAAFSRVKLQSDIAAM
jgi:hypothetical protein